jgi:hypothetical protein
MPWFPFAEHGSMPVRVAVLLDDMSGDHCRAGFYVANVIILTIIVSVVVFVVESLPTSMVFAENCGQCTALEGDQLNDGTLVAARLAIADLCVKCHPMSKPWFAHVESFCIAVFSWEYIARILTVWSIRSEKEERRQVREEDELSGAHRIFSWIRAPMSVIDLVAILPYYLELLAGDSAGGSLSVLRVLRLARILRVFKLAKYSET